VAVPSSTTSIRIHKLERQQSSATLFASGDVIRLLARVYEFRDYIAVSKFLRDSPFLVSLLVEAYPQSLRYFGADISVALQVSVDPEADDYRQLVLLIRTALAPAEALARLHVLDRGWWLDAANRTRDRMLIDVECR
jgi:hypothetical protein